MMTIAEFVQANQVQINGIVPPPPVLLADPFEKGVDLHSLHCKDFIAYLRKQVRTSGRRSFAGYIGDHIDNPVEVWLKSLGFKHVVASSMQYLEVDGITYDLSQDVADMLMLVCDGEEAYQYSEIGAFAMLQQALSLLNPESYLIA